jgi:hypothetical protein
MRQRSNERRMPRTKAPNPPAIKFTARKVKGAGGKGRFRQALEQRGRWGKK